MPIKRVKELFDEEFGKKNSTVTATSIRSHMSKYIEDHRNDFALTSVLDLHTVPAYAGWQNGQHLDYEKDNDSQSPSSTGEEKLAELWEPPA